MNYSMGSGIIRYIRASKKFSKFRALRSSVRPTSKITYDNGDNHSNHDNHMAVAMLNLVTTEHTYIS